LNILCPTHITKLPYSISIYTIVYESALTHPSGAIIHQGVKVGKRCTVGAATYLRHDIVDGSTVYGTGRNQELYTFGGELIDQMDV